MGEHDNVRTVRLGSTAADVVTASMVAVVSGGRVTPRVGREFHIAAGRA
ncbi:hypothetical protein [Collinsella stercoris]|nr:hypothetical protein [Collinsella stercoris]MEE0448916.1 hypothetical protein [Collinsella sp.]MEE0613277.1 hypothetical protein [Collinsella stercoris]